MKLGEKTLCQIIQKSWKPQKMIVAVGESFLTNVLTVGDFESGICELFLCESNCSYISYNFSYMFVFTSLFSCHENQKQESIFQF